VARMEDAVRDFARGKPQFDEITCLPLMRWSARVAALDNPSTDGRPIIRLMECD
jgi:hypothetical protein